MTTHTDLTVTDGPTNLNNLIALYGTVPRIDNLTSNAPTYNEHGFGTTTGATLSYTLDQLADVTIELRELASGEVLGTWLLPAQIAGAQDFEWSGLTPDGNPLPHGDHQWRVTATANGLTSRPVSALMRITY